MMQRTHNEAEGSMNVADGIDCPKCKNRGEYIEIRIVDDMPYEVAVVCDCMETRNTKSKLKKNGMAPLLNKVFDTFSVRTEFQKTIKQKAFENTLVKDGFFIGGQSGAGKTHICSAICNALLAQKHQVMYSIWTTDFKDLNFMMNNRDEYRKKIKELQTVEVLFIDDLFKGKIGTELSNSDITNVFEVLNYRCNNKRKTIISSEYNFNEILKIDEGVAGRIKEICKDYVFNVEREKNKNIRLVGVGD